VTVTGSAGRDGCKCPHGVGHWPEHNALGNFDLTGENHSVTTLRLSVGDPIAAAGRGRGPGFLMCTISQRDRRG
jgi:hypothetical protein